MTSMVKSKSRSSIFSTWTNKDKEKDKDKDKSAHGHKDRSPTTPFSPSSTTSSPLPSTVPNSPLSDPFSCSIALPEPYRPSLSLVSPTFDPHSTSSQYNYNYHNGHGSTQNTINLVSGTEKTPKIVVASPSTGTIHYLFPEFGAQVGVGESVGRVKGKDDNRASRLDPSAAKTIAKSIFKRQSKSVSDIKSLARQGSGSDRPRVIESFYIPHSQLPPGSRPDPLRPAKRVVSGASTASIAGSTTSKDTSTARDGHEVGLKEEDKISLSMRTLRRQPSMADLTAGRKRGEALREAMKENAEVTAMNEREKARIAKRQSGMWGSRHSRRESDTWRDLVNSMTRDQAPISEEMISPTERTFPSIARRTVTPAVQSTRRDNGDTRRRSSSLSYTRESGAFDQFPSIPCPDFGDPIDFSVAMAESPSYSHFDYSTAGSTTMSRSNTTHARAPPPEQAEGERVPTSVDMARGDTRRGLGSYETAKMIARDDAAKRLAGEGPYSILRRSMSFKKDSIKNRKSARPRSQSMSAKSVRDMSISSPVPLSSTTVDGASESTTDKAKKRQSLGPSRGIYLGDLSVDLGGRYTPSSPASSDSTSLYPASTASASASVPSRKAKRLTGKPLHPALANPNANSSEISILAPSTVGLGFSPLGTPASLPESLEAEAIDLTGTYTYRPEPSLDMSTTNTTQTRLPKRSTSLHRIKLENPPLKAKPAQPKPKENLRTAESEMDLEEGDAKEKEKKNRRSFLLAQNTFFIPPLAVPPSLRSSKSLSTLRLAEDPTPTAAPQLLPPANVTTRTAPSTVQDRRTRTGGGFNLCSPPDAIDPLPQQDKDTISPLSTTSGVQRKKSTPFLSASASIRGLFRQNSNSIARTLSHAFDKDPKSPPIRTNMSSNAAGDSITLSPGEIEGEREWREGLLREAVTSSFSRVDVNSSAPPTRIPTSRSAKRMPIPAQLLEAAHVIEAEDEPEEEDGSTYGEMEVEVEVEQEQSADLSIFSQTMLSPSAPDSRLTSPAQKSRKFRPPTPTSGRHELASKEMISPPLPLLADFSRIDPTSSRRSVYPENIPRSVKMERQPVPQIQPIPSSSKTPSRRTSISTTIGMSFRSLTLRSKKSRPKLNLPQPVSSTTRLPPRPLLDELTALEQQASLSTSLPGAEEKARKVLEWRSDVEENGDLAALEEKMTRHVEREKEWMRIVKKREEGMGSAQ